MATTPSDEVQNPSDLDLVVDLRKEKQTFHCSDENPTIKINFSQDLGKIVDVYSTQEASNDSNISNVIVEFEGMMFFKIRIEEIKNTKYVFERIASYIRDHSRDALPRRFNIRVADQKFAMEDLKRALNIHNKFPDLHFSGLPKNAPELWPGKRHTKESLPDFFDRVWGQYVPLGLTLAYIRREDRRLYNAICNWIYVEHKEWPSKLRLPKQREILAENIRRFFEEGPTALTIKQLTAVARALSRARPKEGQR